MNNNIAIGVAVTAVAIIGVIFYATMGMNSASTVATSTPTTVGQTPPQPSQPGAPAVVTNSNVTAFDTAAILTGVVTPNGAFTSYWYEYGTSHSLGNKTANQGLGSGYAAIAAPGYVVGLSKDMIYFYRLAAQNQYGTVEGATYSFQTAHGTPAPVGSSPTIKTLAASGVSRTGANLNGEVAPNKASTTYWFEYGKTANLGATTAFESVGDGNTNLPASATLSNLDPGTTYYFRIDAQNQFGTVSGTIITFATAGPAAAAPTVITRNASGVSTSTATLHGNVDPNLAETTYWFEYSTDSLLGSVLLKTTNRVSAGSDSAAVSVTTDLSGLVHNTTYYFRLVAQNNLGIAKGDRATFKTK